jgi:succinyl-CoA synthetase beta subunit
MDLIAFYGGQPANFLDMGGGAPLQRIKAALKTVLSNPKVKVLFVNIMGGITHCDEVAKSILLVRQQLKTPKPLVVRLMGTNEAEGKSILTDAGVPVLAAWKKLPPEP